MSQLRRDIGSGPLSHPILYHAFSFSETEGDHRLGKLRNPRVQKFNWNPDGTPNFGAPLPAYTPMDKPSGEL